MLFISSYSKTGCYKHWAAGTPAFLQVHDSIGAVGVAIPWGGEQPWVTASEYPCWALCYKISHFWGHSPNLSLCGWQCSPSSSQLLLLFRRNVVKAFEMAAIEDYSRIKTATNGTYSERIFRSVLSGSGVAILMMRGTPLLRTKSVQESKSRLPYKCLVHNA